MRARAPSIAAARVYRTGLGPFLSPPDGPCRQPPASRLTKVPDSSAGPSRLGMIVPSVFFAPPASGLSTNLSYHLQPHVRGKVSCS